MRFRSMTKRRAIAAIAFLIPALIGGWLLIRRWEYLDRAYEHQNRLRTMLAVPGGEEYWERRWTMMREGKKASYPWPDGPPFVPVLSEYHKKMQAKWEQAASNPWMTVEPDPLSPQNE